MKLFFKIAFTISAIAMFIGFAGETTIWMDSSETQSSQYSHEHLKSGPRTPAIFYLTDRQEAAHDTFDKMSRYGNFSFVLFGIGLWAVTRKPRKESPKADRNKDPG